MIEIGKTWKVLLIASIIIFIGMIFYFSPSFFSPYTDTQRQLKQLYNAEIDSVSCQGNDIRVTVINKGTKPYLSCYVYLSLEGADGEETSIMGCDGSNLECLGAFMMEPGGPAHECSNTLTGVKGTNTILVKDYSGIPVKKTVICN